MRDTDWTPSIVPGDEDRDVCLVVNDFVRRGSAYCETDVEAPTSRPSSRTCSTGSIGSPSAL